MGGGGGGGGVEGGSEHGHLLAQKGCMQAQKNSKSFKPIVSTSAAIILAIIFNFVQSFAQDP